MNVLMLVASILILIPSVYIKITFNRWENVICKAKYQTVHTFYRWDGFKETRHTVKKYDPNKSLRVFLRKRMYLPSNVSRISGILEERNILGSGTIIITAIGILLTFIFALLSWVDICLNSLDIEG